MEPRNVRMSTNSCLLGMRSLSSSFKSTDEELVRALGETTCEIARRFLILPRKKEHMIAYFKIEKYPIMGSFVLLSDPGTG